jgi:large subunit ribosomal protein L25
VALPEGVGLVTDGDVLVVNITAMMSQEALDAELAEGETGVEHAAAAEDAADAAADSAE